MSDMDDPTPWEDINPPMALAPRPERRLPCSAHLEPASNEHFRNELTACLSLVVPVGMSEESRRDWLAVAWGTLKNLPPDLLSKGCRVARETCDHPSKIVPAIMEATRGDLEKRYDQGSDWLALPGPPIRKHVMDRRGEPMSEEDTEQLNTILESLGAVARYRADGSRYLVA